MRIPSLVRPDWTHLDDVGEGMALLTYTDGEICFEHICDRGKRGIIVAAPRLQIGNGHTLTRDDQGRATVRASILCGDCNLHGWVTDGAWHL